MVKLLSLEFFSIVFLCLLSLRMDEIIWYGFTTFMEQCRYIYYIISK